MNNKVYKKILDANPSKYFYGQVIRKNSTIINLKVLESNYEQKDIINKTIDKIDIFIESNVDWLKHLNYFSINGEITIDNYYIKFISEDEVVIWLKDIEKNKLVDQKRLLQLFMDSITDIVFYKDINRRYVMCNSALENLVGISKDGILGKIDSDITILNMQSNKCEKSDREVLELKKGTNVEEKILLPNGEVRLFDSLKVPFLNSKGDLLGIIGICRDITDSKGIEDLLKVSKKRLQQICENIQDAIILIEDGKVIYVNDPYEEIYGKSKCELYKEIDLEDIINTISYEDRKALGKIDYNKSISVKGRITRESGEIKWVSIKATNIKDKEYAISKKMIIISDITHKVKEEQEFERLTMEFFANISHEFKTPINLIYSSIQMLKLKLDNINVDKENYDKYLGITKQNIFRLLKLITNLMDSTKISSGYFKFNPENYEIINFIEGICLSVADYCKYNLIDIVFDTEVEEKIVAFDLDKMERVILNLISNAIKYSNGKKIEVNMKLKGKYIQISVKDNGVGIPKDRLKYIFDRFAQVNNRMTKISEGSGIGLYLVKSFVKMHGGIISVESELGKGTEFIVRIPAIVISEPNNVVNVQESTDSLVDRIKVEFSDIYNIL